MIDDETMAGLRRHHAEIDPDVAMLIAEIDALRAELTAARAQAESLDLELAEARKYIAASLSVCDALARENARLVAIDEAARAYDEFVLMHGVLRIADSLPLSARRHLLHEDMHNALAATAVVVPETGRGER